MRVRYEVLCGGRLLKVFEQVEVTTFGQLAAGEEQWVDGRFFWKIDEQIVAGDVAEAMIAKEQAEKLLAVQRTRPLTEDEHAEAALLREQRSRRDAG